MKKAVVIGAGQTGRGFITPILQKNEYRVTFIDKNETLIKKLNDEKKYRIRFFGNQFNDIIIDEFNAFLNTQTEALNALVEADIIVTSVFAQNLKDLLPLLKKVEENRTLPMQIICAENGVNIKKVLVGGLSRAIITEGVIFCTTVQPSIEDLDLECEPVFSMPIDGSVKNLNIHIEGMPCDMNFKNLIQRKIYTYNFMSAVVSYLGWYKKYEFCAESAIDKEINYIIYKLVGPLSEVIAKKFDITYEEQVSFTQRAIDKFSNPFIVDSLYRNIRQVSRKLGINERLLSPLSFMIEYGADYSLIKLVIASAIYYGLENEELNDSVVYSNISSIGASDKDILDIRKYVNYFKDNISLGDLLCKEKL